MKTTRILTAVLFCILLTRFQAEAGGCDPPFLLTVSNIGSTEVTLDWIPMGSESEWDIALLPVGSPPPGLPTAAGITSHPFTYSGLTPGVAYQFYLRAVCAGIPGPWTVAGTPFVTLLNNPSACQLGLPVPDNGCFNFFVEVLNAPATQQGIDVYLAEVRLVLRHEWNDDLDIELTSPAGVSLVLSADNGGNDDNYGDPDDPTCSFYTALMSELAPGACDLLSIEAAEAPFIGPFLAQEPLVGFNDGSSPLGTWTLSVCDDAVDDLGSLEFVELVFYPIACSAPSSLASVAVDSTSAVFDWQPGTDCNASLIEFGPPGFTPGTGLAAGPDGTVLIAGCPPFILAGLLPETAYDIYIRESCGSGLYSNNSCPVSIVTPCSPNPITIGENFDGQSLCAGSCDASCTFSGSWFNIGTDAMDWLIFSGPTPTSQTGPVDDVTGGGNYLYMEASGSCAPNSQAVLLSNCILVQTASEDTCHFSFHYMLYGATANALQLDISTDGGLSWTPIWLIEGDQGPLWKQQYLNLSAYDGQIVQFRFVGYRGLSTRSDIALDNLYFFGSLDQGSPSYVYYVDQDMDGYGNPNAFLPSCLSEAPPGYVANNVDCLDASAAVNPDAEEIPCDGFDSNCNGMEDDTQLPPPITMSDTICSGGLGLVSATPAYSGMIIWYDSPTGGVALDTGLSYFPQPPLVNNSPDAVDFVFYAEEKNILGCFSPERGYAHIRVNPQPALQIPPNQLSAQCAGDTLDLDDLIIQDLHNTNPALSFHSAFPPNAGNLLSSTLVTPLNSTYYYIQALSAGGCAAYDSVFIDVAPSPVATILGDSTICRGGEDNLQALDAGSGQSPYTFEWSNTVDVQSIVIFGSGLIGSSEIYSVTITDANDCASTASLEVTVISSIPSVQNSTQPVTTCGGSNGSIQLLPGGGVGPFLIEWAGPQSGSQSHPGGLFVMNNLEQGSYSVTITDSSPEACPLVLPLLVVNGPDASVSLENINQVSCAGAADACIELEVMGTDPQILWSTGDTTASVCGLSGGFYSVTVTDGACENVLSNIAIFEPDSLVAKTTSVQPVSCFGGNDGAISVLIGGGAGPYSFLWSTGAVTQNIDDLSVGFYTLTVTDQNGCVLELDSMEVTAPEPLVLLSLVESISCPGVDDGEIYLQADGGTGPYSYQWSTGGNLAYLENLSAGNYGVTLSDANDCVQTAVFTLSDPVPLAIEAVVATQPSCAGVADGSLTVAVSGGAEPYGFLWSSGDNTATATGLAAGGYVVSVNDAAGCLLLSDTFLLEAPQAILVQATINPTSCLGLADGAVGLTPLSGQLPFDYEWSNGSTGATINALAPGAYQVTITAANGCRDTLEYVVGNDQPIIAVTSIFPPICNGGSTGQIFLTAMGGTPSFSYQWSNGATTSDISQLSAGTYVCTIEDGTGCLLITDSLEVPDPPLIEIELRGIDNISCFGAADGNIDMLVSGGVPPYLFTWSNEAVTEDLSQVPAGVYTLSVEDALGCTVLGSAVPLNQPPPLSFEVEELDENIECTGNLVDTIFLNVSGGTPTYAIEWSNGGTDPFLTGVPSGDYAVTITDINGCILEGSSIKYPEPTPPISLLEDSLVYEGIGCDSLLMGGRIQVVILGGFPPYQFNWNNGQNGTTSSDTISLEGLNPGYYYVTVTDGEGCVADLDSILVSPLQALGIFVPGNGVQHVSCNGGSDGSIQLNVAGGATPYSFIWTNLAGDTVSTDQSPTNLPAGTYAVKVFDIAGCHAVKTGIVINQPLAAISLAATVEDILCFGENSGFINLMVSGGLSPYVFNWSNGTHQEDASNLSAGAYSVTVTDKNGCAVSLDTVVQQPAAALQLDSFSIEGITCFGTADGAVDISVSGGTPPYIFIWNNNQLTEDIANLSPGWYDCFITDSLGCSYTTPDFAITQPNPMLVQSLSVLPAYPDSMVGSVEVELTGGTPPYTYLWSNGDIGPLADSLASGTYQLEVTDSLGCPFTLSVYVPEDPLIYTLEPGWPGMEWTFWPNPANGEIYLQIQGGITEPVWVELYDAIGRTRSKWPVEPPYGQEMLLELPEASPGVYWLQLRAGKRDLGRRLLIIQ